MDKKIPIHKVGVVVVKYDHKEWQTLLLRPNPKKNDRTPPLVPPRGTRQYQDADGEWKDAREVEDAIAHAKKEWEKFADTAQRELWEEAGIAPELSNKRGLTEIGEREYIALHKPEEERGAPYRIHWFLLELKPDDIDVQKKLPEDATEIGWFTLEKMEEKAALGEARPGYVAIVKEAMELAAKRSEARGTRARSR